MLNTFMTAGILHGDLKQVLDIDPIGGTRFTYTNEESSR